MASERSPRDGEGDRGPIPLDIDNVQLLLQVEQVQIQKRTFTNWVNAQLSKRKPPCVVRELFSDFCDGSRLLDLLEVMSGQRMSRERGRGTFQHRSNIETALNFLKSKSIKLVNINIPDIIDGKPSIILGLIWTIILQYHIEELASCLSFSSRQSSMDSLASLDTRSSLSSYSSLDSRSSPSPRGSPLPTRRASPLHNRFKISAKKALLLWVREQCHKAGYTLNVKDFKSSWRSGVVFLAILYSLRPDLVNLSEAQTRSNLQNLEAAFGIAERELRIPRLLEPCDVDVRDPEEKSIMTYVSQFLQYSRDLPLPDEDMQASYLTPPKTPSPINLPVHYTPAVSASPLRQVDLSVCLRARFVSGDSPEPWRRANQSATPNQKAQEVTCWLLQAYEELLEGWDSTEGESYAERYHVFQTFVVSFNEQRRPVMPLLTAMKRSGKLSEEQRALREAWDALAEKLRDYKVQLDVGLPAPLASVGCWLMRTEGALTDEEPDPLDPGRAAQLAGQKRQLLNACLEEMPQQVRAFQMFQNVDESGNLLVPDDKLEEMKRRFTSVRVTAKYHGIKLEYQEQRHTVLELLARIRTKLRAWKRPYISQESVRVLLQEWHELVDKQQLPSLLEAALQKLKHVSGKYSSKSALAADYGPVKQQVEEVEEEAQELQEGVTGVKSTLARVLSAWDSYSDTHSSLLAWLEQGSLARPPQVSCEVMSEWSSRQTHLNQVGEFLMEVSDPHTTRTLAEDLRRLNQRWAHFLQTTPTVSLWACVGVGSEAAGPARPPDLQVLIRDAMLILKEPLETMSGPLRTYRKRIQFMMRKMREVDLETEDFPELSADQRQKLTQAVPEVMQTLSETEQLCVELQQSVCGLDGRLAELLHWELEARELYQVLKAGERRAQRTQDPRARVFISRGLQLEGQVVTEEQDLQVMVMMSQKNSPVQYIHASAMQDRVRAAVAQSQAMVGMLSSLGARRDRSPLEDQPPPPKSFVMSDDEPVEKRARVLSDAPSSTQQMAPEPQTEPRVLHQQHQVPTIVVQEYRDEVKMSSPPLPYSYAQAVTQTRPESALSQNSTQDSVQDLEERQIEAQEQAWAQQKQEQEQQFRWQEQQQLLLMQEQQLKQEQQEKQQQQQQQQHQPQQQQQRQPQRQPQRQQTFQQHQQQQMQQQHAPQQKPPVHPEMPIQKHMGALAKELPEAQPQPPRQPAEQKQPLSQKELQGRKALGRKNRPWLQKKPSDEQDAALVSDQALTAQEHTRPSQSYKPRPRSRENLKNRHNSSSKDSHNRSSLHNNPNHTNNHSRLRKMLNHSQLLRLKDRLQYKVRDHSPRPSSQGENNQQPNHKLIFLQNLSQMPRWRSRPRVNFSLIRGLKADLNPQCLSRDSCKRQAKATLWSRVRHGLKSGRLPPFRCSLHFTPQDIPKVSLCNNSGPQDKSNRSRLIHSRGSLFPKPSSRTRVSLCHHLSRLQQHHHNNGPQSRLNKGPSRGALASLPIQHSTLNHSLSHNHKHSHGLNPKFR
ncbi:unnamed protein product [Merluccius merluccius]